MSMKAGSLRYRRFTHLARNINTTDKAMLFSDRTFCLGGSGRATGKPMRAIAAKIVRSLQLQEYCPVKKANSIVTCELTFSESLKEVPQNTPSDMPTHTAKTIHA
jgi:hypothetical protein